MWPGVWIGSVILGLGSGQPPWLAGSLALFDTLGPALAASLLRQGKFSISIDLHPDLWKYVAVGTAVMWLPAGARVLLLALSGALPWSLAPMAWLGAWSGHAMGIVAVGIPLLTLSRAYFAQGVGWSGWPGKLLASTGLVAFGSLAVAVSTEAQFMLVPLMLLPHLLVGWLAARKGMFAAASAALLVGIGAVLALVIGGPPPEAADMPQGAAILCGYLFTLMAIPPLMTTLVGKLTGSASRWRAALQAFDTGVAELDVRSGRLDVSATWLDMLGYASQEFGPTVRSFWEQVHPDDLAAVKRSFEPLRSSGAADGKVDCRLLTKAGGWLPFELRAFVIDRDAAGAPLSMAFLARDLSQRQAAREQQRLFENLFQIRNEGLLITDAQHRALQANSRYFQITGQSPTELLGQVPALLRNATPGSPEADAQARIQAALASSGVWREEVTTRGHNGQGRTLATTVSAVKGGDGLVQNLVLAVTDITQSRQQFVQLQRHARFDQLTGLSNRVRLTGLLLEALATSKRDGSLLTVCSLDLDHFKPINEQLGHDAGDQLLLKLAERLRKSLRTSASGDDLLARIGGDEFVLLLRTVSVEESRLAVDRILQMVGLPFDLSSGAAPVVVTASIGATLYPLDNADAETLLRHADHAMHDAKRAGRNVCQFFDAEHERLAEARFAELGRVQEALNANELRLHFQPKVDLRDGRVLGMEALLRWNHPEQGLLTPAHFLPLIEQTELGSAVGDWVLRQGIEQLANWQIMGLDLTVSINVSARHLQDPMFASKLAELLAGQRFPVADRLVLEVLETTALADIDFTCGLMEECRALGVRFALDDFGTGYSTLTYLKRLPLDMLKIDRSFVVNMLNDRQGMAIVEGVIGLSRTFGCTVVAEGVETLEQAQALIDAGCDIGQGNGIAPAMPAADVFAWVHNYPGISSMAVAPSR